MENVQEVCYFKVSWHVSGNCFSCYSGNVTHLPSPFSHTGILDFIYSILCGSLLPHSRCKVLWVNTRDCCALCIVDWPRLAQSQHVCDLCNFFVSMSSRKCKPLSHRKSAVKWFVMVNENTLKFQKWSYFSPLHADADVWWKVQCDRLVGLSR
jgi:hypothetical protein